MAEYTLAIKVTSSADTSGIKKAGQDVDGLGRNLKQMLTGGAILAIGKQLIDMGNQAAIAFAQFEKGMAEVFTLINDGTPQSRAAFDAMTENVQKFALETGRTTTEIVPALYQALSAGVPPDNVFDFMETASDAALGGVTDLETVVDGLTSVVNSYGSDIITAGEASDIMFQSVKLGKTTFDELSRSLFNVIPTATSLGVTFQDVAADLAAMTAQGVPTSVATTQLRQAMVEASKSGSLLDTALRDLHQKGFADLIADGMTMPQIFASLRASMPEQEFRDLFSSVEASNAALLLTSDSAESVISNFGSLEDVVGTTAAAAEVMEDTLAHLEARADSAADVFKVKFGESMLGAKQAFLEFKVEALETGIAMETVKAAVRDGAITNEEYRGILSEVVLTGKTWAEAAAEIEAKQNIATTSTAAWGSIAGTLGEIYANRVTPAIEETAVVIRELSEITDEQRKEMIAAGEAAQDFGGGLEGLETATASDLQAMVQANLETQMLEISMKRAEEQAAANKAAFDALGSGISAAHGPIQDLIAAQADWEAAQGEFVTVTRDNYGEIGEIGAQLAGDLDDETKKAYSEILNTVEEGSQEWLSAYSALQGDLTAAQRQELVARQAELEAAGVETVNVFTGDAAAAEEAQERMAAAHAAISESYRQMAFQIVQSELATKYGEDALAAQLAAIQVQQSLGLVSAAEAEHLREVAQNTDAIQSAVTDMTNQFLTDGELTRAESEQIAEAVRLIEEGMATTAEEAINLAAGFGETEAKAAAARGAFGQLTPEMDAVTDAAGALTGALNSIPTQIAISITAQLPTNIDWNSQATQDAIDDAFGGAGYQHGGYTGGRRGRPAGIVHGEEYVFDAGAVDRLGLPFLESLHGGQTTAAGIAPTVISPSITINVGSVRNEGDIQGIKRTVLDAARQLGMAHNA
jgi:TP901 family phage tail tape measure protein